MNEWQAREFAPRPLSKTIHGLAATQQADVARLDGHEDTARRIVDCDRELTQYRAAFDARAALPGENIHAAIWARW